jgi:phage terminase small subunit
MAGPGKPGRPLLVDRELFALQYVARREAKAAYIAAGGKDGKGAANSACLLMKDPVVRARIAELTKDILDNAHATAERTLLELARVGYSDIRKLFDPETGKMLPVHLLDADSAAAISGIEVEERTDRETGEVVRTFKIRRTDKNQALNVLARHHKLIGAEIDETVGAAIAIGERMERARARLRRMRIAAK